MKFSLRWRHNGHDCVSNHQPHHCLLNRLFRRRSKKTSKLRVTGLCVGNSPGTGEFPAQRASNAENVSIWWGHHVYNFRKVLVVDTWITSQRKLPSNECLWASLMSINIGNGLAQDWVFTLSTKRGLVSTYIWLSIGSGNGMLPDNTKPLSEPSLTNHQWGLVAFTCG